MTRYTLNKQDLSTGLEIQHRAIRGRVRMNQDVLTELLDHPNDNIRRGATRTSVTIEPNYGRNVADDGTATWRLPNPLRWLQQLRDTDADTFLRLMTTGKSSARLVDPAPTLWEVLDALTGTDLATTDPVTEIHDAVKVLDPHATRGEVKTVLWRHVFSSTTPAAPNWFGQVFDSTFPTWGEFVADDNAYWMIPEMRDRMTAANTAVEFRTQRLRAYSPVLLLHAGEIVATKAF